jgi:hypothetical protein
VAVVAAVVLCAAGGLAARAVGPTVVSSPAGYAEAPVLGVDGRGDQVVAWTDYRVVPSDGDLAEFAVMTASRAMGQHGWGSPKRISGWDEEGDGPVLAISSSGAAVLAWTASVRVRGVRGNVSVIEATTRASAGARWRAPVRVATSMVGNPVVGIDDRGAVTAAWSFYRRAGSWIEYTTASAATGVWTQPRALSHEDGTNVQLAVNDRGDTLVSWQRQVGQTNVPHALPIIHYAQIAQFRPAHGHWQQPLVLARYSQGQASPGAEVWAPTTPGVVLDAHGGATVMWISTHGAYVVHHSAGAARWTPAHLLATDPIAPVLGTDANGALTVARSTRNGKLLTTTSNDGVSWSPPTPVPHATNVFIAWLSVGARGNAILTWAGPSNRVLVSTRSSANASWTPPATIGKGGFPQAALDRAGTAAIVWPRTLSPKVFAAVIQATTYPAR